MPSCLRTSLLTVACRAPLSAPITIFTTLLHTVRSQTFPNAAEFAERGLEFVWGSDQVDLEQLNDLFARVGGRRAQFFWGAGWWVRWT